MGDGCVVDECTVYAANIILDATLGVFVEYLLLKCTQSLLDRYQSNPTISQARAVLDTGKYHDVDGKFVLKLYLFQLLSWFAIVSIMKVSIVALMQMCTFVVFSIR